MNPFESVQKDESCTATTTALEGSSTVRNVFVIERESESDGFEGDLIHYGQNFVLSCEPFADMTEKT